MRKKSFAFFNNSHLSKKILQFNEKGEETMNTKRIAAALTALTMIFGSGILSDYSLLTDSDPT